MKAPPRIVIAVGSGCPFSVLALITYSVALSTADPLPVPNTKEDVGELSFTSFDHPLDPAKQSPKRSLIHHNLSRTMSQDYPTSSHVTPPPLSFAMTGSSNISVNEQVVQREGTPPPHIPSQSRSSSFPTPTDSITSRPAFPSRLMLQCSSGSPTGLNLRW
jgi:hypothetical protein